MVVIGKIKEKTRKSNIDGFPQSSGSGSKSWMNEGSSLAEYDSKAFSSCGEDEEDSLLVQ